MSKYETTKSGLVKDTETGATGVFRTVGGRRIFIKEGQDLASAMKESGKFGKNKKENIENKIKELEKKKEEKIDYNTRKEIEEEIDGLKRGYENIEDYRRYKAEIADKSHELKVEKEKINQEFNKRLKEGEIPKDEYDRYIQKMKKITEERAKLKEEAGLLDKDLSEARKRFEEKEREKKYPQSKKYTKEENDKTYNKLIKENNKQLQIELENNLRDIEKFENDYGIEENVIDSNAENSDVMKKIRQMYDDEEISDYVYENFMDNYNEKISNIMEKKGYEIYNHNGKIYYSMLPKAKEAYDNILNELDKRKLKYKISRSWNAGELPSIYIENEDGNTFRIANHFNSKNQQIEAYSYEENKIYSTEDYINYKETVIKDLEKWLKENE